MAMEITQLLVYAVIAIELVLVLVSLYLYSSHKIRIFLFLSFGFLGLLLASAVSTLISGNTDNLSCVLDIAAGLFFLTGILTAV